MCLLLFSVLYNLAIPQDNPWREVKYYSFYRWENRHSISRRCSLGHSLSIEKLCNFLQSQPSQEWAKCTLHPLIPSLFQRTLTSASYWDALASVITVLIASPVWDDSGWKMLETRSSQEVLLHLSETQPGERFWLGESLTLSKEEHLSCLCAQAAFHIKEQVKINQKGMWRETELNTRKTWFKCPKETDMHHIMSSGSQFRLPTNPGTK